MIFTHTPVLGCFEVEVEPHCDDRGLFARTFDCDAFAKHGLDPAVAEASTSFNRQAGTLRGLHLQGAPHEEAKLVRCVRGRVFDVAADIRPESASYLRWHAVELDADQRNALYIPPGVAHGFLTLSANCELIYQMSTPFHPESAAGVRWDDPQLDIAWPEHPSVISVRDRQLPHLGLGS